LILERRITRALAAQSLDSMTNAENGAVNNSCIGVNICESHHAIAPPGVA
jgi:hypothetical protein